MTVNINDLLKERKELLKTHPELQQLQDKIDEILDKTSVNNRMEVINIMMTDSLLKLQKETIKLNKILLDTKRSN